MLNKTRHRVSGTVRVALLFLDVAHQKKSDAPKPVSWLDLLHALMVEAIVSIDAYHENAPDKAVLDGR